jgi:hypothetical protein
MAGRTWPTLGEQAFDSGGLCRLHSLDGFPSREQGTIQGWYEASIRFDQLSALDYIVVGNSSLG